MTKPPSNRIADGWANLQTVLEVFDVRASTFRECYRPLIPETAIRRRGRETQFHMPTVLDCWGRENGEKLGKSKTTKCPHCGI